jgi:hypothetical protein
MKRFVDIISCWPSVSDFASDIGVRQGLASLWKHRDRIPGEYWCDVVGAASRRGYDGVTHEALCRIGSRQDTRSKAGAGGDCFTPAETTDA